MFQSELSKAFNSVSHITLKVDLSEYSEELLDEGHHRKDLIITLRESLLTYSKETIKNVLREAMKKFNCGRIDPIRVGNVLILKVNGYKEYFKGNI